MPQEFVLYIERLEWIYDIRVYSYAVGYKFRQNNFSGGRLDMMQTIKVGLEYYAEGFGNLVDKLINELDTYQVSLAITDFEPGLPRAGVRNGIPFISVDN